MGPTKSGHQIMLEQIQHRLKLLDIPSYNHGETGLHAAMVEGWSARQRVVGEDVRGSGS